MTTGKIKWYNDSKGYGFIETDNGEDVFVHRTGLTQSVDKLETGQKVEFDIKDGDKGRIAVNVNSI